MRFSPRHSERNALEQAEFQEWVASMDHWLDEFMIMLPSEVGQRMDFTPGSLDVLERWVLDRYPSSAALTAESEMLDLQSLACYVGETVRRNIGGEWSMVDDPKSPYSGVGLIMFTDHVPALVPTFMLTTSTNRRTGHSLRKALTGTGEILQERRNAR